MTLSRFATRLNSFGSAPQLFWPDLAGKPTMMQMVERAATVKGLTDVDLNFPDHVAEAPKPSPGASATSAWRSTVSPCATTPTRLSSSAPSQIRINP